MVLLVLLRLLDPAVTARTLLTAAGIWVAGWGFWAWRDHRAWRRGRSQAASRPPAQRSGGDGADGGGDDDDDDGGGGDEQGGRHGRD